MWNSGDLLGHRFTLLRRLGVGGMGEVWLVRDASRQLDVAAKLIAADAPMAHHALLEREHQLLSQFDHPHIVRSFDFVRDDEVTLLTMEHLGGPSLDALRAATVSRVLDVAQPIAGALAHLHERDVVHRDVKVDNVLRGDDGTPKLIDLGIAALQLDDSQHAVDGGGSPFSRSPEQWAGLAPRRSDDIYALGVLLYELLSGRPPFWPHVTADQARSVTPPSPVTTQQSPEQLTALIATLLAKSPDRRPASMKLVAAELASIRDQLAGAAPPPKHHDPVRAHPPPRIDVARAHPLATSTTTTPRFSLRLLYLILIPLFALGGVIVFYLLPQWVESDRVARLDASTPVVASARAAAPTSTASDTAPPSTVVEASDGILVEASDVAASRDQVDAALLRAERLMESLASRAASEWAADDLTIARAAMTRADRHLRADALGAAVAEYDRATTILESVAARVDDVLRDALTRGQAALESGAVATAGEAFHLAVGIAPTNAQARRGVERVSTLPELLQLLDVGTRDENAGRLDEAARSYRRAVTLDRDSQRARASLDRIEREIGQRAFAAAMSNGLERLASDDHSAAAEALARAERLRPGSPEVADARRRLAAAQLLAALARHRAEALEHEQAERWREAAAAHESALALDPALRFARDGKQRCERRAALAEQLAFHLDNPHRLSTEDVLTEAEQLLARAATITPAGARHQAQLDALQRLIATASTPVRVELESDAHTDVTIYRVGRLGAFQAHSLDLRPGTYTVVGKRTGYRDVRRELQVVAGERPRLVVRCEERI